MEKQISLNPGECEVITKLATRAIANGDLQQREADDAHAVRDKIVDAEPIMILSGRA